MEIASTVRECLAQFKALQDQHEFRSSQIIEDESGRFRVWVGNISAHRTGRRSLEYRLRDSSNLQATVMSLLKDLLAVLQQLGHLVGPHELDAEAAGEASCPSEDMSDSASADDEDAELFGLDHEASSPGALLEQALDEAHEVITCLLRFSMTLRNPARHDQLKQAAATTTKVFEPYDISHVKEKYPTAPDFLHRRLGKAISKQRQYFKYREEHHLKLAEGVDDPHAAHGERPSTIATSLKQSEHILAQMTVVDIEEETESVYTATSFAPTTAGHASLRPPPLPEAGRNGDPFECPLCYGIIVAEDQRSWRQHVHEDLPPYVCPFEKCISADHRYTRRRDWQRHQARFHNRHWLCPFGCPGTMATEAGFGKHLAKRHDQSLDTISTQRLADACAVADELQNLTCPLCRDTMPTLKRWYKHLGHHLEQFALHALPSHVLGTESDGDDSAVIVDDSDEQGLDVSEKLNMMEEEPDERKSLDLNAAAEGIDDGAATRSDLRRPSAYDDGLTEQQWLEAVDRESEESTAFDPPGRATTVHRVSSYWSVPEQDDFVKFIGYFGRDFEAIAAHMRTKTFAMIRNHYQRQVHGNVELEQIASRADNRRVAGEDLGPPPEPTPVVKRKYDNPTDVEGADSDSESSASPQRSSEDLMTQLETLRTQPDSAVEQADEDEVPLRDSINRGPIMEGVPTEHIFNDQADWLEPRSDQSLENRRRTRRVVHDASECAEAAKALSAEENYEGSIAAYERACSLLKQAIDRDDGVEDQQSLAASRVSYLARIEDLRLQIAFREGRVRQSSAQESTGNTQPALVHEPAKRETDVDSDYDDSGDDRKATKQEEVPHGFSDLDLETESESVAETGSGNSAATRQRTSTQLAAATEAAPFINQSPGEARTNLRAPPDAVGEAPEHPRVSGGSSGNNKKEGMPGISGVSVTDPSSPSTSPSRLSRLRMHGNMPHRCHVCEAGYDTRAELSHHLRVHTPEEQRRFLCEECGKRFMYPDALNRHSRVVHPKSLFCPYPNCRHAVQGFYRQDNLDRHIRSQHAPGSAGPSSPPQSLPFHEAVPDAEPQTTKGRTSDLAITDVAVSTSERDPRAPTLQRDPEQQRAGDDVRSDTETDEEANSGKTKDKMWTEIKKELVLREAIEEEGYEFEETEDFFYVKTYLRYEDILVLAGISKDIRRQRLERVEEIQRERSELERKPTSDPNIDIG